MDSIFAIRIISAAGFSRIEVPMNSTLSDFKKAIQLTLNVHEKEQKLFSDPQNKKQINFPDKTPVTKLGIK